MGKLSHSCIILGKGLYVGWGGILDCFRLLIVRSQGRKYIQFNSSLYICKLRFYVQCDIVLLSYEAVYAEYLLLQADFSLFSCF